MRLTSHTDMRSEGAVRRMSIARSQGNLIVGSSSTSGSAADPLAPPDLLAAGMNITAYPGEALVFASCVCQNIGLGPAYGPFVIWAEITITVDKWATTYQQSFTVPADMVISGTPIRAPMMALPQAESDVARPPTSGGTMSTTYVTGEFSAPLEYFNVNSATYTAGFTIDVFGQVSNDVNRGNTVYNYPGNFSFLSQQAQEQEGPLMIRRPSER